MLLIHYTSSIILEHYIRIENNNIIRLCLPIRSIFAVHVSLHFSRPFRRILNPIKSNWQTSGHVTLYYCKLIHRSLAYTIHKRPISIRHSRFTFDVNREIVEGAANFSLRLSLSSRFTHKRKEHFRVPTTLGIRTITARISYATFEFQFARVR